MPTTQTPVLKKSIIARKPTTSPANAWQSKKPQPHATAEGTSSSATGFSTENRTYASVLRGPARGSEKQWTVLKKQATTFYDGYPIFVIEAKPNFDEETVTTVYKGKEEISFNPEFREPTYIQDATPCDINKWCYAIDWQEPCPFFNPDKYLDLSKFKEAPFYNSYPRL
jgi:hypothetical protein